MARVADKVPLAVTSTDVGSPRESEAGDSSVSSKDQLRARVYSLLALFLNLIMLLLHFSL